VSVRYVPPALGNERPLCPNSGGSPTHPAHELRVRLVDIAYAASELNADGEFADDAVARINEAVAYGAVDDRMHLYVTEMTGTYGGPLGTTVVAWFFRCGICGFVLPAQQVQR
jgi:hypothetical protein